MIENDVLAIALMVLFTVTGLSALIRCSRVWSTDADVEERPVELSHLLMSIAMIAMVGMWGGPGTFWVQVLVFGAFTALFALRAVAAWQRLGQQGRYGPIALGYHALATGAMTWMVAVMTTTTGREWSGDPGGHAHSGALGAVTTMGGDPVDAPAWIVVVTIVLVAGLAAAAVAWVTAARSVSDRISSPMLIAAGATGTLPPQPARREIAEPLVGTRGTTICHALMSAGMAVVLITMI